MNFQNAAIRKPLFQLPRMALPGTGPLAALLLESALHPVYQPIACLADGSIFAHEALVRGPVQSPLHWPEALLKAAATEGLDFQFESACVVSAVDHWGALNEPGRLFVNISAAVLVRAWRVYGREPLLDLLESLDVLPRMVVLEITEHERVADMDRLARVVEAVRHAGLSLALDDFGDGRSSLRLWSQLKPEFVKIDKYFTKDISQHADKLKTIQALQQIANIFGTSLIAEGIETQNDLRVLRDMGIDYGQGYFLGRPALRPREKIDADALQVLLDSHDAMASQAQEFTDDVTCCERNGHKVTLVPGSRMGMKITEPADLTIARALWRVRASLGHHSGKRFWRQLSHGSVAER